MKHYYIYNADETHIECISANNLKQAQKYAKDVEKKFPAKGKMYVNQSNN